MGQDTGERNSKGWAKTIYKYGIMTMLDVPHFGRSPSINACFQLLSILHGGFLWLDKAYPIAMELMHQILGLLRIGEDLVDSIMT